MDCCCPANTNFDAFVSPLNNTRVTAAKRKFSFRATPSVSQSRVTHTSYNHPQLSQQLQKLQSEYQLLREEERVINQFQLTRLLPLEEEVKFYEREIIDRSKEIQELNSLLALRMEERRANAGQRRGQQVVINQQPKEITVTGRNETVTPTYNLPH